VQALGKNADDIIGESGDLFRYGDEALGLDEDIFGLGDEALKFDDDLFKLDDDIFSFDDDLLELSDDTAGKIDADWYGDIPTDGVGNSWYRADGSLNMPPDYGAVVGTEKTIELQPGNRVGRYGVYGKSGDFVTAPGSAAETLSLPPYTDTLVYQEFTVLKPIPGVTQSTVAPWGGSVGGGIQYRLPRTIEDLLLNGYIFK
jgi:hypothetical protein